MCVVSTFHSNEKIYDLVKNINNKKLFYGSLPAILHNFSPNYSSDTPHKTIKIVLNDEMLYSGNKL